MLKKLLQFFIFNNLLLHSWLNDNQILVVHSRWVYNFMGIILEAQVFCLSSLEMLSPALTASPIKDDPDLQWMPLFISLTDLHVVFSLWLSLLTHKVSKSPKSETIFWKECIKAKKNERHLCLQNYTHKIVHSSAMHYHNLIIIHECS